MFKTRVMAAVVLVAGLGCGHSGQGQAGAALPATELEIAWTNAALPAADPASPAWASARPVVVPLLIQDVAEPRLLEKGVEQLELRALHDGTRAAFLLSWRDETAEDLVDMDRSTDAVAIQFPATAEEGGVPDSMMGETGKPVSIAFWRYSWQRRLEGEPWGLEALYPNAVSDHYPPEGAKGAEDRAHLEKLYNPPHAVGNAMAVERPSSAVEDLSAEGFGTLHHTERQRSTGKGVHATGGWKVVITRPLDIAPGDSGRLRPGEDTYIAVAVWNGGQDHGGSRKMRSIWIPVRFGEVAP